MKLRTQLVLLVGLSTFILLGLTGIYLINSMRDRELSRFNQKIAYNDSTVPMFIRIPLWNLDMETVSASLGALFTDDDIQSITLRDPQGQVLTRNQRDLGGSMVIRKVDILENARLLGQVEIDYSTASIEQAIVNMVLTYSLGGCMVLLLSCAVIILSALSITRPLERITAILTQTGGGDFQTRLDIPVRGEIGIMVAAVNRMRNALEERERTIAAVSMESVRNETKFLMEQEQRRQSDTLRLELEHTLDDLRKAQMQLINSEKMAVLGGLVAGIAHEINTPLGISVTAASFLDELIQRLLDHQSAGSLSRSELDKFVMGVRESSRLIQVNLGRAAELIRSFKQVSVDQTSEQRRKFLLANYLNEVIQSLHPRLRHLAVEVRIDCPENLAINSFPGAFAQIVTNLVINSAIHGFRGRDGGLIVITARSLTSSLLELSYHDDGNGMGPEELKHLFEPFYTSLRNDGGSGLGTYTIYNLVTQRLAGSISATSQPGQGLEYRISLPVEIVDPGFGA